MPSVTRIERPWIKKTPPAKKDPFYMSRPWKQLRLEVLVDDPLCWYCSQAGLRRVAKIGDHYKPKKLFPELALSRENIKGACEFCHYCKTKFEHGISSRESFEANIDKFLNRLKGLRR